MKTKHILLTSLLAVAITGLGQAVSPTTTFIRISGATAFRATAQQAALDYINSISYVGTSLSTGNATYAYSGTSGLQSAGAANFFAQVDASGNTLEIQTSFTGAVQGLIALSQHSSTGTGATAFIDAASTGTLAGQSNVSVNQANLQAADVALSDLYAETPNKNLIAARNYSAAKIKPAVATGIVGSNGVVGITPFEYLTSPNNTFTSGATLTSVSTEQVRSLLLNPGGISGTFFSGNSLDAADTVFAVGRDVSAGTRASALSDLGLPFLSDNTSSLVVPQQELLHQVVLQYSIASVHVVSGGSGYTSADPVVFGDSLLTNGTFSPALVAGSGAAASLTVDGTGKITSVVVSSAGSGYYAPTIKISPTAGTGAKFQLNLAVSSHSDFPGYSYVSTGLTYPAGAEGYNSGALAATAIAATPENATTHYITYIAPQDAATALAQGAKALAYNGVPYSTANIENGNYGFWGYEHVYYSTKAATAIVPRINAYAAKIVADVTSSNGIAVTNPAITVVRLHDGPNLDITTPTGVHGSFTNDGGTIVTGTVIPAITQ